MLSNLLNPQHILKQPNRNYLNAHSPPLFLHFVSLLDPSSSAWGLAPSAGAGSYWNGGAAASGASPFGGGGGAAAAGADVFAGAGYVVSNPDLLTGQCPRGCRKVWIPAGVVLPGGVVVGGRGGGSWGNGQGGGWVNGQGTCSFFHSCISLVYFKVNQCIELVLAIKDASLFFVILL